MQCRALLKPQGFLAVELGAGQYAMVRDIFLAHDWRVEPPIYDLLGIERVLVAR
jgi:methylase of polypeptide subunit release factors